MDTRIVKESVVQINERGQDAWQGCLVQVSEVKSWGVQGYVKVPMSGLAYIRLNWDQIEYIGQAKISNE